MENQYPTKPLASWGIDTYPQVVNIVPNLEKRTIRDNHGSRTYNWEGIKKRTFVRFFIPLDKAKCGFQLG